MSNREQFNNKWGIILASLGMAIGAGNLWRFPRMAGQYGGAFIILWILFLFIWSIPILLTEFAIGKKFRKGVIGSFSSLAGKKYAWMGFFITCCTLGIAFYYSVVTAWAVRYLGFSIDQLFDSVPLSEYLQSEPNYLKLFWYDISHESGVTVLMYCLCVLLGVLVLSRGVQKGLEMANRILIPSLFILLFVVMFTSLSMSGGVLGLEYMFAIDISHFSDPKIWIEAVSQSAWSTGAGWGLMITISAYARTKDDITINTFVGALGNNTASLLAGMSILPAVFALANSESDAIAYLQEGNQALTFTVIPALFTKVYGGAVLSVVFFLALSLAAFSSLLTMIELLISNVRDLGLSRRMSLVVVTAAFIIFGFPSAYSLDVFSNQDWVWGVGLIVSGMMILFGVIVFGIRRFKETYVDNGSSFKLSTGFYQVCIYANVLIGGILIYWWMSQGYSNNPWFNTEGLWNFLDVYSNASILTQWGVILLIGVIFNRYIYRKFNTSKKQ